MAKQPKKDTSKNTSKPVKPKLKHPLNPEIGRKKEGKQSSDPINGSVRTAEVGQGSASAPNSKTTGTQKTSTDCLGYNPSLTTGRCRCEVCKSKPLSERTTRPFVNAGAAEATTPTPTPTYPSASSSSQEEPPPKTKPTTRSSVFGGMAKAEIVADKAPHIVIDAKAGVGKTTVVVESLKVMMGLGTHLTLSPQQQAICEAICLSQGKAKSIGYTAFNKDIVTVVKPKLPPGVEGKTMHGLGFGAVSDYCRAQGTPLYSGERTVNAFKVSNLVEEMLGADIRKRKPFLVKAVTELVDGCKVNLIGYDAVLNRFSAEAVFAEHLDQLVDYFDIDLDGTSRDEVYPVVVKVLERCLDVGRDRYIDYTDMVWLPVVLDLPVKRFDLLMVDEAQDLNRCQQALVKKAGERLVFVGDPKQAIYGFAGADTRSMARLTEELEGTDRGVMVLPLTVTRRCGRAIVAEANKIVPDFQAHETNGPGKISRMLMKADAPNKFAGHRDGEVLATYQEGPNGARDGDMVLCRVNAPLVSECFRFIKAGKKANIQGRDVGKGIVKTIQKMKAQTVAELIEKLTAYTESELEKEQRKKFPSDARMIGIQDKMDCILAFTDGVPPSASPSLVVEKIDTVFTDQKDSPGIRLSSAHKAKGLEARRVFFLEPEGAPIPHPMAKTAWQKEQEWNLRYVVITRAIDELIYVS